MSLLELMVVLAFISLMAAAALPAMSEAMADNRQSAAAHDIMRLARRARAEALASGFAHRLVFNEAAAGSLGTIGVAAGVSSSCWRAVDSVTSALDTLTDLTYPPGWLPAFVSEAVMMDQYSVGGFNTVLRAEMPMGTPRAVLHLCYQPNGATWIAVATDGTIVRQVDTVRLTITRRGAGGVHGVPRQIVFPPGGTARLR